MTAEIEFDAYLRSLSHHYAQWRKFYTLTDAQTKAQQQNEPQSWKTPFDFELMAQTIGKGNSPFPDDSARQDKEKIERFPVLDGIRKYVKEHRQVLLVGRPGSGKSTTLARLLLEEARNSFALGPPSPPILGGTRFQSPVQDVKQTQSPPELGDLGGRRDSETHPESLQSIPVLVELRFLSNSTILDRIQAFFQRHDLLLDRTQIEDLLFHQRLLLLMDGLNELPSEAARLDVAKFRQDYPKVPMIFTTRDLSLGGDFGLEKKLEMQPLTEAQMQAFVRSYVPEQAEAMLRQLKDRLREFGQTPLRNSADGVAGGDSGDRGSEGDSLAEPPQPWNITYCKQNYQTQAGANNISYFSETHIDNDASPSLDAGIHMRLGGAHQGWGGTDEITVNFQNEGFHPVQLIKCSVHWKTLDGSDGYALKPDTKIRWIRLVPWQDGYDNFALPKMLNPGHIIQVTFKLTPLDIQASKIDISKYMEAPSNEWMASSIIYEVFAQIRTESNHVMSGSISYCFPRDGDKSLCVLLECPETLREQASPERNRNQNVTMNFYGTVHGAAGTVQGDQTIQP